MHKLRWLALLMGITIAGITGFQLYWLRDNYAREKQNLEIKTNASFRQTILRLQSSKLKLEGVNVTARAVHPDFPTPRKVKMQRSPGKEPPITVVNLLQEKVRLAERSDSARGRIIITQSGGFFDDSAVWKERPARLSVAKTIDSIVKPEQIESVRITREMTGGGTMIVDYKKKDSAGTYPHVDDVLAEGSGPRFITRDLPDKSSSGKTGSQRNNVFQLLYNVDSISLSDSVTVKEIVDAYKARLKEDKTVIDFKVARLDSTEINPAAANEVTLGISRPTTFRLNLLGETGYLFRTLKLPILFSLLLVGITIASFVLLYRSLLRQHRLTQMKNDLISNITHELKTPIATVGVALEALKNFNAMHDPRRTSEYLDISQNELQRLGLLVDKVLKLSMFENRQMAMNTENVDLRAIVEEVVGSLRLQIEKQQATVDIISSGDLSLKGDRMHLLSVVFNLLDNALKYSREHVHITIELSEEDGNLVLKTTDNGIGIPAQYRKKIFDKFFRVPAGDTHNAKGHGLGLSYVSQIVHQHRGSIKVESEEGKGSVFTILLPKNNGV